MIPDAAIDGHRVRARLSGLSLRIRPYEDRDERGWARCRLLAFFDTAFSDAVEREKERYDKHAIELVAEEDGEVIDLL